MADKYITVRGTNYQSVKFANSEEGLMPSVIVYVQEDELQDLEDTVFYIEDIDTEEVGEGMAQLICSQDDTSGDLFFFLVPVAMVGLLTVFGDSQQSLLVFLYSEDYMLTMETGEVLKPENCLGIINTPETGTDSFVDICEKASEKVSPARAFPMVSTVEEKISYTSQKARELAFLTTAGVALGEEHALRKLHSLYALMMNMEQRQSGMTDRDPLAEELLGDTLDEHDEILFNYSAIMSEAYDNSEDFINSFAGSHEHDSDFSEEDLEFVNMLNNEGIVDKLNKISFTAMKDNLEEDGRTPELDIKAPLWPEWPGSMSALQKSFHMESHPTALLSFLDGKDQSLQEFNLSLMTLGYALSVAGRAKRFTEQMELQGKSSSTTGVLVLWLNGRDETHTWEVDALQKSLKHYDLTLTRDLLSFSLSNDGNPENAFWLHTIAAGVIVFLFTEQLRPDHLIEIVKNSEIQPADFEKFVMTVGQFLLAFYQEIMEDAEDNSHISFDKEDVLKFSADFFDELLAEDEDLTLEQIAENFAIIFPILADKNSENLPLGSEEWAESREEFINGMLELCAWERRFVR